MTRSLEQRPAKSFVPYTDALRVSAAIAVIVIHVTGDGASAIGTLSMGSWWLCLIIESLSRWAVPIFVMVSGLLLLDPGKVETPGEFYRKRLKRLAIPVLSWSLFYLGWRWFYEDDRFTLWSALGQLVDGSAYYHLWFLTMLIGLYISTPVLRMVVRAASNRQLWIITGSIMALDMADAVVRANQSTDFTFIFKFCPFIGLFLLGYCLKSVKRGNNMTLLGGLAWLVGAAMSAISTYILVFHCNTGDWQTDDRLFLMEDEFSPGTLIMSVGVFTMFAGYYENKTTPVVGNAFKVLSAASLGVYLSHPLILSILNKNNIDYEWHGVLVGIPLSIAAAAIGSTLLTLFLMKIPYLKQAV
jgi:surface polysaccharide O-acyltransferase-like enzyme